MSLPGSSQDTTGRRRANVLVEYAVLFSGHLADGLFGRAVP